MSPILNAFSNLSRPAQVLSAVGVTGGVGGAAALAAGGTGHDRLILAGVAVGGLLLLLAALLLYGAVRSRRRRGRAEGLTQDLTAALGKQFAAGLNVFKANDKSLYALPWYVLVGEPGAGKTEAIRHSNIGFPPGLNKPAQGRGGTVNMDWWFAKKAVLLDTAGRLMFEATEEWRSFLHLLKAHRPHTPINGMILAIPVTSLQTDNADQIADKAGQIASQFDAVQRALGVRFPVYVLITKADTIGGFREYFHNLSEPTAQNQILGWSNPDPLDSPFRPELVEQHLATIAARLRRRRLGLLLDPAPVQPDSPRRLDQVDALYAFPNELSRISSRLKLYLETIFTPGEWSMSPLFVRGIYFTSAVSEGAALDLDLAESLGLNPAEAPAEVRVFERNKSYFLKDVFLDKCFPEGGLVTGATNVSSAMRRRTLGLAAAATAAAVGLVVGSGYAYWQMRDSIGQHAEFWNAVAAQQPGALQLFDATDGHYRGGERTRAGVTVAAVHRQAADLAGKSVNVPPLFAPLRYLPGAGGNLNENLRWAHRALYEQGVYDPLIRAVAYRLRDPAAAPDRDAVRDLVLLTSGGAPAQAVDDAGPLYRTAGVDEHQLVDMGGSKLDGPRGLFDRGQWPPNANVNVSAVAEAAATYLGRQSADLAEQFGRLRAAVADAANYRNAERDLLRLATEDGSADFPTEWAKRTAAVNAAARPLQRGTVPLAAWYQQLLDQEPAVVQPFETAGAALAPDTQKILYAARDDAKGRVQKAADGVDAELRDRGLTGPPGEELGRLDADVLSAGGWRVRLAVYGLAQGKLLNAGVTVPDGGWIGCRPPAAIDASQLPPLGPGEVNDAARSLEQAAVRYANARQTAGWAGAIAGRLPQSADAWADAVSAERQDPAAADEPAPLTPLPLCEADRPAADDPAYRPQSAARLARDWADFRAAWAPTTAAGGTGAESFRAASDGFAAYAAKYLQHWQSVVAASVNVGPLTWAGDGPRSVTAIVAASQFADDVNKGLHDRLDGPQRAVEQFAQALTTIDPAVAATLTDAGRAMDRGDDLGSYVYNKWAQIAGSDGDATRATTRLLRLRDADLRKLFPDPAAAPSLGGGYWASFSTQALAALRTATQNDHDRQVSALTKGVDRMPLSARPAAQANPLTPAELDAVLLALRSSNAVAGPARGEVPAGLSQPVMSDLSTLRDLAGSGRAVARVDPATKSRAERLARQSNSFVAIFLVNRGRQSQLAGSVSPGPDDLAALFNKVQLVVVPRGKHGSGSGRKWKDQSLIPDGENIELGEAKFDESVQNVELWFTGRDGTGDHSTTCDLGNLWWPSYALLNGRPQPDPDNPQVRYVQLSVKFRNQAYPFWIRLDFERDVNPDDFVPSDAPH